ncbi:MAG: GGDEF domain-containing protein [Cyanomargarita calcarea GSE-NOS-MK-12-04C]|jgi:diguanylate cyclase (GGDEF)-like protein|uniref:GGDEF domain-containing protein n=1 Tax=Cyanomargarita calcarea GSE-NOS-MK-12-04C TaxID=2839659 RepID=A0A951QI66_9CYAN|nr:GGDEF domain-containing protein [Cyanomargarita calcarea GSE-NOS-MK-12-04C]
MTTEQALIALLLTRVAELEQQVKYDRLTRALSQSALISQLHSEDEVTVIAVDVPGLGMTNVREGHDKGDRLLIEVVMGLKSCVRMTDCIYRRGGDEFVMILPHCYYFDADKVESRVRSLNIDLYLGVVSGQQQLSVLVQAAFTQVECQKIRRKNGKL